MFIQDPGAQFTWTRLPRIERSNTGRASSAAVDAYGAGETLMLLAARAALADDESAR